MNQELVNYSVRNITTGDEEDLRVVELDPDEMLGFPEPVRDEITALIDDAQQTGSHWTAAQQRILDLLLPYISDRELYDANYAAWEQNVLNGAYDTAQIPDTPAAPHGGHVQLWLSGRQWRALVDAVGHAADEVHASVGMSSGWGPFGSDVDGLSLEAADEALMELSYALHDFAEHNP